MVDSQSEKKEVEPAVVPNQLDVKVCTCEQGCGSKAGDSIPVVETQLVPPLAWADHLVNFMFMDYRGLSLQEKAVQQFLWQVICPGDMVSDRRKLTAKAQLAVQFFSTWKGIQ